MSLIFNQHIYLGLQLPQIGRVSTLKYDSKINSVGSYCLCIQYVHFINICLITQRSNTTTDTWVWGVLEDGGGSPVDAVDIAKDLRQHTKPSQPSKQEQPLLSPLYQQCGVKCPGEVLPDVDAQAFKGAHPLYFKLANVQLPMRSPFLPHIHYYLPHLASSL